MAASFDADGRCMEPWYLSMLEAGLAELLEDVTIDPTVAQCLATRLEELHAAPVDERVMTPR